MAITFYYWPRSSATRVQWALEELGIPHEKKRLAREKGENKTPEYLAISPMGNIPALVDDGVKLFESLAILIHLGEKYGAATGLWPTAGSPEAGEALSWTVWSSSELAPARGQYMIQVLDSPFALPKELRNPAVAERAKKGLLDRLTVLDRRLEGRDWLVGKGFSIADIASAGFVNSTQTLLGLSLADHKRLAAWLERCISRPAFKRVMGET